MLTAGTPSFSYCYAMNSGISWGTWATLGGAIVLEVMATLSLRASDGMQKWIWAAPVGVGYLGSFICLSVVLRQGMPIGVAYAVWSGVGVAFTALLGALFFHEALTAKIGIGMALIIGGVVLIQASAQSH